MSLKRAQQFIQQVGRDEAYRLECYQCGSKEELLKLAGCNIYEFEEAITMQLFKCQTYEEAEIVKQIKQWFTFF